MASARITATNENISTYGGGGRDYSSLAAWEAATATDLVTGMQSEVLECYADAEFDDSVVIQGAVTNASYFRIIRAAPGHEHNGIPGAGVRFASSTLGSLFNLAENFCSVQDVEVQTTRNSGLINVGFNVNGEGSSVIGGMAIDMQNDGAEDAIGFQIATVTTRINIIDCITINPDNDGFRISSTVASIYNCTAIGGENGFQGTSSADLKNCLASGASVDCFDANLTSANNDYNASSDATAPGSNSRTNQTFTFVDAASDNYHLSVNDQGARNFGLDLSSDSDFPFDDDIDGDEPVMWSIGFDSLAFSPGPAAAIIFYKRRRRVLPHRRS